ncbi:MAG TPA: hypothetical protein VF708_12905, partial [Pyrinomonadaceae bacterium]
MKTHQILIASILWLPLIALACLVTVRPQGGLAQTRPPYASDKPLAEPTIFAEGMISTEDYDSHPAFTPDGQTLYEEPESAPSACGGDESVFALGFPKGRSIPLVKGGVNAPPARTRRAA